MRECSSFVDPVGLMRDRPHRVERRRRALRETLWGSKQQKMMEKPGLELGLRRQTPWLQLGQEIWLRRAKTRGCSWDWRFGCGGQNPRGCSWDWRVAAEAAPWLQLGLEIWLQARARGCSWDWNLAAEANPVAAGGTGDLAAEAKPVAATRTGDLAAEAKPLAAAGTGDLAAEAAEAESETCRRFRRRFRVRICFPIRCGVWHL